MATTCERYLDDIYNAHYEANWVYHTYLLDLEDWFKDARFTHTSFDNDWRIHISSLVNNITSILNSLIHGNYMGYHPYRVHYYLANCMPEPEELTWKTICEAWAKDDFEGRFHTIAFIDRMRQIIWDEPFNILWAAKPEDG